MMKVVTKILMIILLTNTFAVSETLQQGIAIEGSVDKGEAQYYQFYGFKGDTVIITLDHLEDDADLYVNLGALPKGNTSDTCHSWNSHTSVEECVITLSKNQYVYINVAGYKGTPYRLNATVNSSVDVLEEDKTIFGGVHYIKEYKYYKIDVQAGDELRVDLTQLDADADLYVKYGSKPKRDNDNYDCVSKYGSNSDETCTLEISHDGTVYIGVQSWKCIRNVQYKIKATLVHQGQEDNSIQLTSSEEVVNQIANRGNYKYYKIYVHAGERVNVNLYNQDANGNLYVKVGEKASKENYDCKSENGGESHSTEHDSCSLLVNTDSFVYIAVHAPTYGCNTNVKHTVMAYKGDYGVKGPYQVLTYDAHGTHSYYPVGVNKSPIVIFLPGWHDTSPYVHENLLRHIASQGYTVILKPVRERFGVDFRNVLNVISDNSADLDTSRVGVIGWSHGGGIAYSMMRDLISKGYGEKGRFIMPIEPMFAIDMNREYLSQLTNMNFLMMSFHSFEPDVRTMFMEYSLLTGNNVNKNYMNLAIGNGNHGYLDQMKKDFLTPLDALMAYSFKNDKDAYDYALDGAGKYNPKNVEAVFPIEDYSEPCTYSNSISNTEKDNMKVENDIDYCAEVY